MRSSSLAALAGFCAALGLNQRGEVFLPAPSTLPDEDGERRKYRVAILPEEPKEGEVQPHMFKVVSGEGREIAIRERLKSMPNMQDVLRKKRKSVFALLALADAPSFAGMPKEWIVCEIKVSGFINGI